MSKTSGLDRLRGAVLIATLLINNLWRITGLRLREAT